MLVNSYFWNGSSYHIYNQWTWPVLSAQFHSIGNIFTFWFKFSWNKGIDTCFNVECVLLDCNFDFLGGYLVVTARYLVVTTGYCSIPGGYCLLLVVTAHYHLLMLILTFSLNSHFWMLYCWQCSVAKANLAEEVGLWLQ